MDRLAYHFNQFLGGERQRPGYYTAIVNERNFDRLDGLLELTKGEILYGGDRDRKTRFFAPTIVLLDEPEGDSLLSEELFGPILPVTEASLEDALAMVRTGEHPLAVYGFTNNAAEKERILDQSQSGGVTFNDCFLHAAAKDAPFGGVGNSGLGYYHGRYGVLAFSHLRTHMEGPPSWMESLMWFRYPPYTTAKTAKAAPKVSPPFDRDGNDTKSKGKLVKLGLVMSFLVGSYAMVSREQVGLAVSKFL